MKSIGKISLLLFLMSLCLVSCRNDEDNEGPTTTIPVEPPQINVQSSIYGLVKDNQGVGVEGASVEVDGELIGQTDVNGAFSTGTMQMNQYGTHVSVTKDGYFLGSKFVQPDNGQRVYTEMKLVSRTKSGEFTAANGATITSNGNATIEFGSAVIADKDGNVYSGNVNVFSHWYDPSSASLMATMPGDLRAVNADQEFQQLGTYGMMAVELEDDNGNELNILEDKSATVTFPVPASLLDGAPSTIPLWHYDEDAGYWLEDGSAPLVNGEYIAELAHFSFWNCDIPENFIDLTGKLLSSTGNGLDLSLIKFTAADATYGYAYTQSDGIFSLKVPKDQELTMEVSDYCDDVIYSDVIGPFAVNTTLPDVSITANSSTMYDISGKLNNCTGGPITNGYLKMQRPNGGYSILYPNDQGEVSTVFMNCDAISELTLIAYDFDDNLVSDETTLSISGNPLSFGTLSTCSQSAEHFDVNYNGELFTIIDPYGGAEGDGFYIEGLGVDSLNVSLYVETSDINTPLVPAYMQVGGIDNNGDWFQGSCQGCTNSEITLTESAMSVGDYYEGTYDVELPNEIGVILNFSGSFRVEREN